MIKKILGTALCIGAGIAVAAAVDDDFRDCISDIAGDVKKSFSGKVNAEPDDEPEGKGSDAEDPEPEVVEDETPVDLESAKSSLDASIEAVHQTDEKLENLSQEIVESTDETPKESAIPTPKPGTIDWTPKTSEND